MPRLTPAIQAQRREHILDAAERCFARSGFHRTTMHDICKEAGVSAGALYIYFPSKEALIAGISERDRAEFARRLELLAAMPRLTPAIQAQRREHILDAAERCFARSGFHRTTMHDICKEAGVSAGALYIYFPSKEALIAGISERDRAEFARRLELLAAAPDFLAALSMMGEQYFVDEPAHKRLMCIEIGVESTRNPQVGEIYRSVDTFVLASFEKLFQRLKDEGRIAPSLDIPTLARVFITIGDGLFWRRAVDPSFDGKAVLPAIVALIGAMLNPTAPPPADTTPQKAAEAIT